MWPKSLCVDGSITLYLCMCLYLFVHRILCLCLLVSLSPCPDLSFSLSLFAAKFSITMSKDPPQNKQNNVPNNPGLKDKKKRPNHKKKSHTSSPTKPTVQTKNPNQIPSEEEKKHRRNARFNTDQKAQSRQPYGFISRGEDNRLQKSASERHKFFDKIIGDFVDHCEDTTTATLSEELQSIVDDFDKHREVQEQKPQKQQTVTIESILSSLRKLREALLSCKPDAFSVKVFLFSVRISASMGHYQTYIPSINYLLRGQAVNLLEDKEYYELATVLILHLAHFNNQHTKALETYYKFFSQRPNPPLLNCIKSWYLRDFHTWVQMYNGETDNCRARIMSFGVESMVNVIISTINAAYFTIDTAYLTQLLPNGVDMSVLTEKYHVTWTRNDKVIVVRERKR